MRLLKGALCSVSLFLASTAFSNVKILATLIYSEKNIGKICEELTFKIYKDIFSKDHHYHVMRNISYSTTPRNMKDFRVIGELDILVFYDNKLTMVGEVKCPKPKNLARAKKKAIEQTDRFVNTCVGADKKCFFWAGKDRVQVGLPEDPDEISVGHISWKGAESFLGLDNTYEEIDELEDFQMIEIPETKSSDMDNHNILDDYLMIED